MRVALLIVGMVLLVSGLAFVPPSTRPMDYVIGTLWVGAGGADLIFAAKGSRVALSGSGAALSRPATILLGVVNLVALLLWLVLAGLFLRVSTSAEP